MEFLLACDCQQLCFLLQGQCSVLYFPQHGALVLNSHSEIAINLVSASDLNFWLLQEAWLREYRNACFLNNDQCLFSFLCSLQPGLNDFCELVGVLSDQRVLVPWPSRTQPAILLECLGSDWPEPLLRLPRRRLALALQ